MHAKTFGFVLLLAASAVGAAPAHDHEHGAAGKPAAAAKPAAKAKCEMCAKCAMCREKMAGGKGGMMGGMMGGGKGGMMGGGMMAAKKPAAPNVTVAADGSVVVVRGNTLLKYDAALKLVGQVELPAEAPAHEHH